MRSILLPLLIAISSPVAAQGLNCPIPRDLPQPEVETPQPGEINNAPATQNLLALSWSPQFCRDKAGDNRHDSQCGTPGQFGFILHGLWPDGPGRNDPAWCRPAQALTQETIRRNFCMTPSPQLLQHEWQKHGTCATSDPDRYFTAARALYAALRWPDMNALSHQQPSVAAFTRAIVAANPGVPATAIRIDTNQGGWLKEVKICLNRDYRPQACPSDMPGARGDSRLKIWRAVK